jgi:phosphodiesterase/alkaline phosphatase D-like protein
MVNISKYMYVLFTKAKRSVQVGGGRERTTHCPKSGTLQTKSAYVPTQRYGREYPRCFQHIKANNII